MPSSYLSAMHLRVFLHLPTAPATLLCSRANYYAPHHSSHGPVQRSRLLWFYGGAGAGNSGSDKRWTTLLATLNSLIQGVSRINRSNCQASAETVSGQRCPSVLDFSAAAASKLRRSRHRKSPGGQTTGTSLWCGGNQAGCCALHHHEDLLQRVAVPYLGKACAWGFG